MELVVAEPHVISPAVIRFDGNGRMYVAEFITYMRDADGNNQHAPESRITRFESTKNDGVYDKRTVFVDKLVLPRTVVPLDGNSILTNETASDDVVKYTDTNNDGVADKREHFYSGIGLGRDGNLEHEQAGFVWGLDNWIYTTYNAFRFRWTPDRHPEGADRPEQRLVGRDDGRRREDVVHRRRRRARADELPGADPLRRVHRARPVRAGIPRGLAGDRPVRHAGRHDPRPHAGRPAQSPDRGLGRRRRPRAPRAGRSARRSARSPSRSAA